jgi:hypothetical protein
LAAIDANGADRTGSAAAAYKPPPNLEEIALTTQ